MARAHLLRGGLALAVVGALAAPAFAQGQTEPLTVKKLSSNVYVAEGGGGNSGIIIGNQGVIISTPRRPRPTAPSCWPRLRS